MASKYPTRNNITLPAGVTMEEYEKACREFDENAEAEADERRLENEKTS